MESDKCPVCQCDLTPQNQVRLSCAHSSCSNCLIQFIDILKKYKKFHPDKLICLTDGCKCQIDDNTITKLFKGEEGFIMNIIRKRYKQSQDPNTVIFHCQGYLDSNRKPLVQKSTTMTREQHSKLVNPLIKSILNGKQSIGDKKMCTYIHSFNKSKLGKETCHQCYLCGATYCIKCLQVTHEGKCPEKVQKDTKFKNKINNEVNDNDAFQNFLKGNQMIRCLNQKCGLPIAKEQGCYWIKCRCSWQFCYPCKKLWGDCQHFSKYPYKKFVPPPQWMIKALKLY